MARYKLTHGVVVAAVIGIVILAAVAIRQTLASRGIDFSFAYLSAPSRFNISEGLAPTWTGWAPTFESANSASSNLAMLAAGLFNSIKVALLAIVFSTMFGIGLGVSRLSTNWLVRNLAFSVGEFIRNTPLLIQLMFWYFAVMLQLPSATSATNVDRWFVAEQSGVFLPLPHLSDSTGPASTALLAAAIILLAAACLQRFPAWRRLTLVITGLGFVGASYATGFSIDFDLPVLGRFGATGGMRLTPEMSAILIAIMVNSAAYIAEIVRGAIEGLPKGQWEAAAALGLSRGDTIKDVVLPQVFRVILPSLTNRYISLTKDTSIGIAVGFPDLFSVSGTVANQTGRDFETVIVVMATYLLVSWIISAFTNVVNRRIALERA
ncbi:ABC transporter permease subunit [Mesorhizobium sp. AR07]|uniref:ABC transporter permease subunit n=1 Tax=Mesorhizobium sp. AR07 TaxID=2865838 RepID=UPI00215F0C3A|nr:ABC transporter permease subunit [Mesorhizobium sp. AR07]